MAEKENSSERFKSRKKALDWLQGQGHKVSQGKFYQDCKAGFPYVAKDGSVSKYQVMVYAKGLDEQNTPDLSALDAKEFERRKAQADAEIAEIKAERMRREADSNWLHADEAWAAVAGLVGRLRDTIRHHLHTGQREVVYAAGGEQERSAEVFEVMDALVDKAFNEVAGDSIDITFVEEEQ